MADSILKMEGEIFSEGLGVATAAQCKLLLSRDYQPVIKALWLEPGSAGEVAERLGLPLDKVYFRVRALKKAGLLREASVYTASNARPTQRYTMSHAGYELPFSNTPSATLEELVVGEMLSEQRRFAEYLTQQLIEESRQSTTPASLRLRMHGGHMVLDMRLMEEDTGKASVIYWNNVQIDPAKVLDFKEDLLSLIAQYRDASEPQRRRPHRVGIQLVEIP